MKTSLTSFCLWLGLAALATAHLPAHGGRSCNLVVSSNADAGPNTLREAIACATSGQTITFAPALANQTITLASTLEIPVNKNLTIDGLAATNLTISGNNAVRVFLLRSTSVQPTTLNLKNLRIINGYHAEYGGGIRSEHQGAMNIENCTFANNNAEEGGSAVFSHFEGRTTLRGCKFDGNVSIAKNTERGSTVMLWGPFGHTIQNCEFTNNRGINGGGINGLNAALLVEDCLFQNNRTTDAFFDTGKPNDFLRGFGAAIYTDRATAGPPSTAQGSIILRRSRFLNNQAEGEGGACYLYTDETDNVLVEDCFFDNNSVMALTGGGSGGSGGAIQQMNNAKNRGFVVRNTTFANNRAGVVAGAVRADWADTQIENCTFFNNRAELTATNGFAANGGALAFFSMSGSNVEVVHSTFAQNYAGWVGGAIAGPPSVRIRNNVFFQNTAGNGGNTWNIRQQASEHLTDLGGNLQFPDKANTDPNNRNVSASVTIANPLLSPLADNGGPAPTMALDPASPAIDAGVGPCLATDQRGQARPSPCDAGAYEAGPVSLPPALPAAIGAAVAISCSDTEASLIAKNATRLTVDGSTYYIGYRQVTADNQNPVVVKFTGGVRDWCREDYETTGDDGKGYGLYWNGQSLYAVFTATGTQGTPAQDYRRFTASGWLKTFSDGSPGGGGGPKVAIVLKLSRANGEGQVGQGTFVTSRLQSSGKTNSLEVKDLYMNTDGHLVVRANSWFAPRNVNKAPLFQTPATGGSPHDYTLVITQDLTTAICASAVGWNNVSTTVNTPCNATPAAGANIVSVSKLAFCAGVAASFQVHFALGANIAPGTTIQAEISDASGNFAGNVVGSGTTSPLTANLPTGLAVGSYRLRLVAALAPPQPGTPFADRLIVADGAVWTGAVDTDWDKPGNWSCSLPNATTDVVIPGGLANMPVVGTPSPVCRHLTLQPGARLSGPGTLNVKGHWDNQGTYQATEGTIVFSGSTAQEVRGGGTFFALVVDNAQGLALSGPTNVKGILTLRNGNLAANGQLVLLSDATATAMVVNQNGAITGTATVQRYVDIYTPRTTGLGYNYLASPMRAARVSELADDFSMVLNGAYDWVTNPSTLPFPNFYRYRETKVAPSPANFNQFERGWESPASPTEVMQPMEGYIANLAPGLTLDVRGTPNNGDLTRKLTRGLAPNSGWALLGNPYPAPIDWDKVWDRNQFLDPTIQRRIAIGQFAGTWAYYVANTPLGTGTNDSDKNIALMQGFLARVTTPGEYDLFMDNTMRLTTPDNPRLFRPEIDQVEYTDGLVKLRLAGQGQPLADETIVYFRQGATTGPDRAYDAVKTQINAAPAPNLLSAGRGTRYAVNAQPELTASVEVPLHFSVASTGTYTLSPALLALFKGQPTIQLEDRRARVLHDLRQGAYTFAAAAGGDTSRFFLRVGPDLAALQANQQAGLLLYPNPAHDQLTVQFTGPSRGPVEVRLTDPTGRTVRQWATEKPRDLAQRRLAVADLPPGLYLLTVLTTDGALSQKWVKQ